MRSAPQLLVAAALTTLATVSACTSTHRVAPSDAKARTGEEPLALLKEGNRRFAESRPAHPSSSPARRREVTGGQHPFAVVVGCADSRVPVELVFDRGIGDIFTVRNAGNVVERDALASIDYATTHLDVPLVVVMGHGQCGAVAAALAPAPSPEDVGLDLQTLIQTIQPALRAYHVEGTSPVDVAAGVEANVRWSVARLREEAESGVLPRDKDLLIIGAIYDLESGRVRFLEAE